MFKKRQIFYLFVLISSIFLPTLILYGLPSITARNVVMFYYIPIMYAAFRYGRQISFAIALLCSLLYLPFVFANMDNPLFKKFRYDVSAIFHIIGFLLASILTNYFVQRLNKEKIKYKNLYSIIDTKVNQLIAIDKIIKEISSTLDLKVILDKIMDSLIRILNAESCSIWLIEKENPDKLCCKQAYGLEKNKIENVRINVGDGISGWVAKFGIPQKIDDLSSDPRYKNPLGRETNISQLSVPLKFKDKIIGVMNVFNKIGGDKFTDDDLNMLTIFAGHSAIAIENARLYEISSRKLSEMSTLLEITKMMIFITDIDDLLYFILDSAIKLLLADSGSLMLIDPDTVELKIKAARGLKDDIDIKNFSLKLSEGISGYVASTNNPVTISGEDERLGKKTLLYKNEIKSTIAVPLEIQNTVIGVLNLNREQNIPFTKEDLEILIAIANHSAIAIEKNKLYQELIDTNLKTIQALAYALDARDKYTAGHSTRTTKYAKEIAKKLKLSDYEIKILEYAASLHDIGKIGVPDEILNKPYKLTEEEFELIKKHVKVGANIVAPIEFLKQAIPMIYYHHERYDGLGYPEGLKEEEIPIGARILSVVDAYEAMVSDRPYRPALSHNEAIHEILRFSGMQFDPKVVEAFLEIITQN